MRIHILLIDDDGDELDILCTALQNTGIDHKCTWAKGVKHALAIMEYVIPDIIFIDQNMPSTNGMDGIRMIRECDKLRDLPLILYSNSIPPEIHAHALQLGASRCIEKPSTIDALSLRIKQVFGETQPILLRMRAVDDHQVR